MREGNFVWSIFYVCSKLRRSLSSWRSVEVMCDHEKGGDRVRDWLVGTVVQVDPKMIAVQFQENVYLTDGWMVPDHVLWCPKRVQQCPQSCASAAKTAATTC